jgi:hypothetical protein
MSRGRLRVVAKRPKVTSVDENPDVVDGEVKE